MRPWRIGLLVASLLLGACGSHHFKRGKLGGTPLELDVSKVPVRGFLIEVEYFTSSQRHNTRALEGELLAIDQSHLWILDKKGRTWAIARHRLYDIELQLFFSDNNGASLWTVFGAMSTLSHGRFLLASLPIWLITGIPAAVSTSGSKDVPGQKLDLLYQYARFPAGVPPRWRAQRIVGERPPSMGRAAVRRATCLQRCVHERARCDAACSSAGPCRGSCWDGLTSCQLRCHAEAKKSKPPASAPTSAPSSQPASRPSRPVDETDEPGLKKPEWAF